MKKEKEKNLPYNADITKEDLKNLRDEGLSMDTGDDRLLPHRKERTDFTGKDLDIPGTNKRNLTPSAGISDEENSLYGQGGERKENLETPERANTDKRS